MEGVGPSLSLGHSSCAMGEGPTGSHLAELLHLAIHQLALPPTFGRFPSTLPPAQDVYAVGLLHSPTHHRSDSQQRPHPAQTTIGSASAQDQI